MQIRHTKKFGTVFASGANYSKKRVEALNGFGQNERWQIFLVYKGLKICSIEPKDAFSGGTRKGRVVGGAGGCIANKRLSNYTIRVVKPKVKNQGC